MRNRICLCTRNGIWNMENEWAMPMFSSIQFSSLLQDTKYIGSNRSAPCKLGPNKSLLLLSQILSFIRSSSSPSFFFFFPLGFYLFSFRSNLFPWYGEYRIFYVFIWMKVDNRYTPDGHQPNDGYIEILWNMKYAKQLQ